MKPLKIGLVLDDSLDRPDGVQQYVLTLGSWLQAHGHTIRYLSGATTGKQPAPVHSLSRNVNIRFNRNRMSIPLPANRQRIRELLAREHFDVLHVQVPCSPWLAGRVVLAADPQTAVVGTFHIAPHSAMVNAASRLLAAYEWRVLRRFQTIVSVSPAAQTFARQAFGLKSAIVPNAIDLRPFKSSATKRGPGPVTIAFLGRLVERKGCRYLLEAVAELMKRRDIEAFKVMIAGRGPLEASLKQFAAASGISSVVQFVGFLDESDKPGFLAQADIAVFPSTGGESFGIVLLEAMAASPGVVLAGNNDGYASVMEPKQEQLFQPQDTSGLADKLALYINDKSARSQAHDWQTRYVKRFDIAEVGPDIVKLYHNALHEREDMR